MLYNKGVQAIIALLVIAFIALLVLKASGVIISWWLVLTPVFLLVAFVTGLCVFAFACWYVFMKMFMR